MQELVGEDAGAEVVAVLFVLDFWGEGVGGLLVIGVSVAGEEGGEGDFGACDMRRWTFGEALGGMDGR